MKIQKLVRQYGEHGNDYSMLEIGDKVNEIIDAMKSDSTYTSILDKGEEKEGDKFHSEGEAKVEFESLKEVASNYIPLTWDIAVRSNSSQDRVYLIREGKKHWIKNPETLFKLGFNFHNVKNIGNEEMDTYETSDDMDLQEEKPLEVITPKDGSDKYSF
jgi:hypothetical protein